MRWMKGLLVVGLGALGALYLLNPTAGLLELIPDITPLIGNLDEATAMLLVLNTLRYFGLDLTQLLGRDINPQQQARPTPSERR